MATPSRAPSPYADDGRVTRVLDLCGTLALLAYPFVVYAGYRNGATRVTALILLLLVAPIGFVRLRKLGKSQAWTLAIVPLVTATLLGLSAVLNANGLVLAVPSAVNLVLLLAFGVTLRWGPPMVERLARLQDPTLSEPEMQWCRLWTKLWCGFFVANAAVSGALASAVMSGLADMKVWALYNGLVAYVLMGIMFTVEWVLRKLRFGGVGDSIVGKALVRMGASKERR